VHQANAKEYGIGPVEIKITAHKFCPDDQDFTTEVETKLKTREEFMEAMNHVKNGGEYFYQMYEDGKFVSGLKSDNIL
jgi:hypothetical protein